MLRRSIRELRWWLERGSIKSFTLISLNIIRTISRWRNIDICNLNPEGKPYTWLTKPRLLLQLNLHVRRDLSYATTYPKHQDFPSQSVTVGTSVKRPFPVSDQDHFLYLTVNDFPLFLNSCKRPLDTFSDLYLSCVHYATKNIRRTLVTTWNYRCRNLDIACNKYLP